MLKNIYYLGFFILILSLYSCVSTKTDYQKSKEPSVEYPRTEREFRAAWVATVANINWPSKPGLPVDEQKREALKLLNLLDKNNFQPIS